MAKYRKIVDAEQWHKGVVLPHVEELASGDAVLFNGDHLSLLKAGDWIVNGVTIYSDDVFTKTFEKVDA